MGHIQVLYNPIRPLSEQENKIDPDRDEDEYFCAGDTCRTRRTLP
jgi:hypothetical protein